MKHDGLLSGFGFYSFLFAYYILPFPDGANAFYYVSIALFFFIVSSHFGGYTRDWCAARDKGSQEGGGAGQKDCTLVGVPVAPALMIALKEIFMIVTRLFNPRGTLFQSILQFQLIASWQHRGPLPFLWLVGIGGRPVQFPVERQAVTGYSVHDDHHARVISSKG